MLEVVAVTPKTRLIKAALKSVKEEPPFPFPLPSPFPLFAAASKALPEAPAMGCKFPTPPSMSSCFSRSTSGA